MMAVVTASGKTKKEVINKLREAVDDFEREQANNCLAEDFEYEMFDNVSGLKPMTDWLNGDKLT